MLTALETGVRGGRWHALNDKVRRPLNLYAAAQSVEANNGAAGVDHVSVTQFAARQQEELDRLEQQLRDGTYRPQQIRRTWIPKPGSNEQRPLGIPTVRDRRPMRSMCARQTALLHVVEPIFDHTFHEHSYGFRRGRGCQHALRRVEKLLADGYTFVVDADLKSYFDTIPHDRLMDRVREKVSDGRLLRLVEAFLKQGVLEGLAAWTPEQGTPQGAVISPLLANVYLNPLDHLLAEAGFEMVRYADDFVILCRTREDAERALATVQAWVADNGRTRHPDKTKIVDSREDGFDFLGYHFRGSKRFPRKKSLAKIRDAVRPITKRQNGNSLACIIARLNVKLRGWFAYFRHCHPTAFPNLDGWIRRRLRTILRKRHRRKGMAYGLDHQRWPNTFFHEQGLYCLKTAYESFRQSCFR
jgi:RNA-directed DNA polymerase